MAKIGSFAAMSNNGTYKDCYPHTIPEAINGFDSAVIEKSLGFLGYAFRKDSTEYKKDAQVMSPLLKKNNRFLKCVEGGITGTDFSLTYDENGNITDGTVKWKIISVEDGGDGEENQIKADI